MDERELEVRVERIVEKYLREKHPSLQPHQRSEDFQQLSDLELLEKHFQKNQLLNQVVHNFTEIIRHETQMIQEQFTEQMQQLELQMHSLKEMMLRSISDSQQAFYTSASTSKSLNDSILDSSFNEKPNDKSQKNMLKKIKETEDSLKQRIQHTDNLLNILMDNQVASKNQITDLFKKVEALRITEQDDQGKIKQSNQYIEDKLEMNIQDVNSRLETHMNQQKDKIMFYWTVLNDLTGKHDKLRKEFDDVVTTFKNPKQSGGGGFFKRGSILGFAQ